MFFASQDESRPFSNSARELLRDLRVQINCVRKLLLLDVLTLSMRDVNRSWPDQQRLTPVAEKGNIGSECGSHRRQAVNRAQAQERNVQRKVCLLLVARRRHNLAPHVLRRSDKTIKQIRMSIVSNHIRREPPFHEPD